MEATKSILRAFPFLQRPELEREILENATVMDANPGDIIVREGQYLKVLPLLISGALRVIQQSGDREILLYYVRPGETCMMSLASCFFNSKSPSTAIVESKAELLCVPAGLIKEWQRKYDQWNEFVIRTFQNRYAELLNLFNSVVFTNIETRLSDFLIDLSSRQGTSKVTVTHLALANALGTTRVVISRILKRFEQESKIKLLRGSIQIIRF